MPVLGIVLAATLAVLPLSAQEGGGKKSVLSVQVGPSGYTGRFLGITRPTHAYRSDLRPGMAWNVFYGYRGLSTGKNGLHVGPGLLYQGSFYRASWTDGSDHIGMHYLAPQFAFFGQHGPWAWQAALGVGWLHYNDHSRVYGKPRQVTMNKLGVGHLRTAQLAVIHLRPLPTGIPRRALLRQASRHWRRLLWPTCIARRGELAFLTDPLYIL